MARVHKVRDDLRDAFALDDEVCNCPPLTERERKFITAYMRSGNAAESAKEAGFESPSRYRDIGVSLLNQPNVQAEIQKILKDARSESIATSEEVMNYFTSVMRGEVKDQFGLEASLADRTKAAQELAKRTIDIENRESGKADTVVQIKLDWSRD